MSKPKWRAIKEDWPEESFSQQVYLYFPSALCGLGLGTQW